MAFDAFQNNLISNSSGTMLLLSSLCQVVMEALIAPFFVPLVTDTRPRIQYQTLPI
ncbi:hypothetical protein [Pseudomonas floridensis]|uniref:hypothetical protein n=1 Tax=Pseudomonas floridensis TaxID=1958950 RepID=UPI0012FFA3CA|nr:hypothetical protein [Pseudomonas floridensis]